MRRHRRALLGATLPPLLSICCATGPDGRALLAQRQYRAALEAVRPKDPAAYRLRARAWIGLSKLDMARAELRIAVAVEADDDRTYRLLARVERDSGNQGAELRYLERVVSLDPKDSVSKRRLARLLLRRSAMRLEPALGLRDPEAAARDLRRAASLDVRLSDQANALRNAPAGSLPAWARPFVADCPGAPRLHPLRPLPHAGCQIDRPHLRVEATENRYLLPGCTSARTALQLERNGCVQASASIWQRLMRTMPRDPRWPLELARAHLARRNVARAELLLVDYRYLSSDREDAALVSAKLLAAAGYPRRSARVAIEALSLARQLDHQLEVVTLLAQVGQLDAASRAADTVLAAQRGLSTAERAQLERRLKRIIGAPPRKTPAP